MSTLPTTQPEKRRFPFPVSRWGRLVSFDDWLPGWAWGLLALGAVVSGLALARLPLLWAVLGLLIAVLAVGTLIDPLVGVGVTLILGPTKPLTDYFVPALPLDAGQIALIVTLGAWFLHAARRKRITIPRTPLTLPLLIFIGAAGLSTLNALSLGFALKELIKWGQLLIMLWLVIDLAGERRWPVVVGLVLAAAAIQALIGVWQFGIRGEGPEHFLILDDRFYRAYGTFEQPNPYGGFIGLALPLAVGLALAALGRWAEVAWARLKTIGGRLFDLWGVARAALNRHVAALLALGALAGLLLAALLMSWSRGAWLGFGAAVVVIALAWPRRWWVGVALVGGGLLLGAAALRFNLLPASISTRLTGFTDFVQTFDVRGVDINSANYAVLERLAHWQTAQEMARYHPILGVGFGNYEPVYPGYALINWEAALGHAHNYYLNLLAETGVIGLAAYGALWIAIIGLTWRVTRRATGWARGAALGLIGAWAHLSVHHLVDKLYVANLHLHIGALLGVLSVLAALGVKRESSGRESPSPGDQPVTR
jgi:putative inorganic carbon (HCO3(-)) transporter